MKSKSNYINNGRYSVGGVVEEYQDRLGWWERTTIPRSTTDVTVTLTNRYNHRPDLLAYDMYGQTNLTWLVLQYNNIININTEFTEGARLTLPTKNRVFGEILSGT